MGSAKQRLEAANRYREVPQKAGKDGWRFPDVIGPELKVRGMAFFILMCNVRKTESVVSRSKHD